MRNPVEYRIRIDFYFHAVSNIFSKPLLVLSLGSHKLLKECAVLSIFFKPFDLLEVCLPVSTYGVVDQLCQPRICLHHESAVAYSVGFIVELVRLQLIELAENRLGKDIAVQSRYSVD